MHSRKKLPPPVCCSPTGLLVAHRFVAHLVFVFVGRPKVFLSPPTHWSFLFVAQQTRDVFLDFDANNNYSNKFHKLPLVI